MENLDSTINKDGKEHEKLKNCTLQISEILETFGFYQIRSLIILGPAFFFVATLTLAPVYLNHVPPFTCKQSKENNMTIFDEVNGTMSGNFTFPDTNSCYRNVSSQNDNLELNSTYTNIVYGREECSDGWTYKLTKGNTMVSEFDLVCSSSWKRPIIFSLFMLGHLIGSIAGGRLADRFGRRFNIVVSFTAHILISVAASFSPFFFIYVVLIFCLGIVHSVLYFSAFVLGQELVHSASKRTVAALFLNICYNIGAICIPLIAYLSYDWRWIYRIVAIVSIAYAFILWFVPKSPKWLLRTSPDKATTLLKNIAKTNGIKINEQWLTSENAKLYNNTMDKFMKNCQSREKLSPSILLKNKILRRRILIVCFLWNVAFFGYYVFALNSSNIGGNAYVNGIIGGAADICSTFFMWLILKKFGRRSSFSAVIGLSGVFAFLSQPILRANLNVGIAAVMIGRFFSTTAMMLVIFYTGELFPTLIRNTSVGIASMSSRLGSILTPFLILAGEEVDISISFYVIGFLCLLGALLTCLLPETGTTVLPNTLNEALELETHKRRYSIKGILDINFVTKDDHQASSIA